MTERAFVVGREGREVELERARELDEQVCRQRAPVVFDQVEVRRRDAEAFCEVLLRELFATPELPDLRAELLRLTARCHATGFTDLQACLSTLLTSEHLPDQRIISSRARKLRRTIHSQ